jgi:hypothetical protein
MLVPTGIRVLDQALGGGTPRNLWGLQGKPGSGKNIIFTSMAKAKLMLDHHADRRTKLGIIGLENGTGWLTRRWQAEDLDLSQKEIGSKKLSPEEALRKAEVDQRHFELLKRIHVYRYAGAGIGEVVRRIMRWIFDDEHHRGADRQPARVPATGRLPRARDERHHRPARSRRQVRHAHRPRDPRHGERAEGQGRPAEPRQDDGRKEPRRAHALRRRRRGARASGPTAPPSRSTRWARARWPNGPTCEFKPNYTAGTLEPEAGRPLDLDDEEAKERREAKERSDEENVDAQIRRAAIKARRMPKGEPEPEKPAATPPAQAPLLEVPQSKKPENAP